MLLLEWNRMHLPIEMQAAWLGVWCAVVLSASEHAFQSVMWAVLEMRMLRVQACAEHAVACCCAAPGQGATVIIGAIDYRDGCDVAAALM
jgi:hypothetical protein